MAFGSNWMNIASGSFSKNGATLIFYIDAKLNSQSIADNTSVIGTRMRTEFSGNVMGGTGYSFTCTGCSSVSGSEVYWYSTETIRTGSITITHNDDGSKTLSMSGTCTNSYLGMDISISGSVVLPTIARASKPSVSAASMILNGTDSITINTNRKVSSFTHTLKIRIGSNTATFTDIGASYTFKPTPSIWMPYMTSTQMTATVTCTTYSGSTRIGSDQTCTFKINVDQSQYAPVITSVALSDTNNTTAAVEAANTFINGVSNLRAVVELNVSDSDYVNLATAVISAGSQEVTEYTLSGTTATLTFTCEGIEADHLQIEVTDQRGTKVSQTISLSIVPYQPLSITSASIYRSNQNGEPSATGSYIHFEVTVKCFAGSFGGRSNEISLSYYYKDPDTTAWTQGAGGYAYTATGTGQLISHTFSGLTAAEDIFDYESEYDLKFVLDDLFSDAESAVIRIHEGLPVIGWGRDHADIYGSFSVHNRNDASNQITYAVVTEGSLLSETFAAYGYITTNGTKAVIYIPMHQLPVNPRITSFIGDLRTASGGYLGGSQGGVILTQYIESVSALYRQGILSIIVTNTNGWGVTNNTPIVGYVTVSYDFNT